MNVNNILALYDKEQRQEIEYPDVYREETAEVVRFLPRHQHGEGGVIYSQLNANNADVVIKAQIAYFEELGLNFEWKVFHHDFPTDLKLRLVAAGFKAEEKEAIMALDVEHPASILLRPITLDIRAVNTVDQLADVMAMQEEVWQTDFMYLRQRLADELQNTPDHLKIYAAYANNKPVSAAWVALHPKSRFAGLWGGSTLPAYRRQGYYQALLSVRLEAARQFGARYLTVDAGPMSRPILEKLGFQTLGYAHACKWTARKKE